MKKSAQLSLKIEPELKARIERQAAALDRSVNWLATQYLRDGLDRDEQQGSRQKTKSEKG